MTDLYGPLGHSGRIAAAVKSHLQDPDDSTYGWLTAYLAEMERQIGDDPRSLPIVRMWRTSAEIEQWFADTPPAIIIAVPGTLGDPETTNGAYRVNWDVRVGILVSVGGEDADAEELAGIYGAAVRGALVHHPALAAGLKVDAWLGETLDNRPRSEAETIGFAINTFRVSDTDSLARRGGPATPPVDPYDEPTARPTVQQTDVTVDPIDPEA